jgi:signal transduction histidine kinase
VFYVSDDEGRWCAGTDGSPSGTTAPTRSRGISTSREGTGIGPDIVRTPAEPQGWDVAATADESDGARVSFTGVAVE